MTDRKELRKIGFDLLTLAKADVLDYEKIASHGLDLQLMAFCAVSPPVEGKNVKAVFDAVNGTKFKGGYEACR